MPHCPIIGMSGRLQRQCVRGRRGQDDTICAQPPGTAELYSGDRVRRLAGKCAALNPVANPTGEIGQLRDEALPVVRVIVPPDRSRRVFEDDLDSSDLVFDGKLTPMLVWYERYPVGRGWRSGWVLSYDSDGNGNPDDYIVGLGLPDVDAAVAQAREYMRSVGYPLSGWRS
jgi:hypothetical protein